MQLEGHVCKRKNSCLYFIVIFAKCNTISDTLGYTMWCRPFGQWIALCPSLCSLLELFVGCPVMRAGLPPSGVFRRATAVGCTPIFMLVCMPLLAILHAPDPAGALCGQMWPVQRLAGCLLSFCHRRPASSPWEPCTSQTQTVHFQWGPPSSPWPEFPACWQWEQQHTRTSTSIG